MTGVIAGNDFEASKTTLSLTTALGSSVHYPVGAGSLQMLFKATEQIP